MTSNVRPNGAFLPGDDEVFFDTWLLSAAGTVFLAESHWQRTGRSWDFFGLPGRPDRTGIELEVAAQAGRQPGVPRRVRVGFSADGGWAVRVEPITPAEICPQRPWRVAWVEAGPVPDPRICLHKTLRNRHWTGALALARRRGLDDALVAMPGGIAAEFSRGNLFILEGHRLVTPPLETPLLPGVMRQALLEWAGVETSVEPIDWPRLQAAGAVLMTNSVRLVVPVGEILSEGRAHPLPVSAWVTGLQAYWRNQALAPGRPGS